MLMWLHHRHSSIPLTGLPEYDDPQLFALRRQASAAAPPMRQSSRAAHRWRSGMPDDLAGRDFKPPALPSHGFPHLCLAMLPLPCFWLVMVGRYLGAPYIVPVQLVQQCATPSVLRHEVAEVIQGCVQAPAGHATQPALLQRRPPERHQHALGKSAAQHEPGSQPASLAGPGAGRRHAPAGMLACLACCSCESPASGARLACPPARSRAAARLWRMREPSLF